MSELPRAPGSLVKTEAPTKGLSAVFFSDRKNSEHLICVSALAPGNSQIADTRQCYAQTQLARSSERHSTWSVP